MVATLPTPIVEPSVPRQAEPIIKAERLTKRFGDLAAVDGISFEVMPGETFGLLGPNGAGKTTTMRMIACVSPVTDGELSVDGLNVETHSRAIRERMGVVAQQDGLDPDLKVRENLISQGRMFGIPRGEVGRRADAMLDLFDLRGRADSDVSDLSGGLKRRLTLARAFLTRPRVVVLDEPTTGLDPQSRNRAWGQLARMKTAGATILMSTHYMEEASMLCDHLVIMDNGRILAQGGPDELIERYAGSETAAVRPFPGHSDDVQQQLEQSGLAIQNRGAVFVVSGVDGRQSELSEISHASVMFRPSNLEDVFLSLTGRELREE